MAKVRYIVGWQKNIANVCILFSLLFCPFTICAVSMVISAVLGHHTFRFDTFFSWFNFTELFLIAASIFFYQGSLRITDSGISFPLLVPSISTNSGQIRRSLSWREIEYVGLDEKAIKGAEQSILKVLAGNHSFKIDLALLGDWDRLAVIAALSQQIEKRPNLHNEEFDVLNKVLSTKRNQKKNYGSEISLPEIAVKRGSEATLLADKQIVIKYSSSFQKFGLFLCSLTFPFWGMAGFLLAVGSALCLFSDNAFGQHISRLVAGFGVLIFPLLFIGGLLATTAFFDTSLIVGEEGICFPLYLMPFLRFRRERNWGEIRRIAFAQRNNKQPQKGKLHLYFLGGGHTSINLARLKADELEFLLLSINIWGQRIDVDPEIKLLQENLSNKKLGLGAVTYTKMWEDEMNRRFSSTSFVPLQPGQQLRKGSLEIIKQLAFGGMSAVYLCQLNYTKTRLLKEFVVPKLDSDLQAKARDMFEREAKILMKLSHPRLPAVHDFFVEEGRTYLLLDYIPGTDLRQIVTQKGKLPESKVVEWAKELTETLTYLHEQVPAVVHRDLTPDNILLNADGQIMIIDFGAANEFVGTATGTLVGKESFISPEQFRGDTVLQSDIYSLGATMFYLLTGEDPQPLSQSQPKRCNPLLSTWINQLVADCTAFEPEHRVQSAADLLSRLSKEEVENSKLY